MSLFGGSSSSSTQNYLNQAQEVGADNGSEIIAASSGATLNVTDGGAIEQMGAITQQIIAAQQQSEAQALTFAQGASDNAMQFAQEFGAPNQTAWENTLKIAAAVVVALAIAWVVKK